jgi:hypothetical protein
MEGDCFFIEGLDTCVQYEVSVRAANGKGENGDGVIGEKATETAGNYKQIFFFNNVVVHKGKVMVK